MSEDSLRKAYQAHVATRRGSDRSACPPPEQLETLARRAGGERRGEADAPTLEHVLACAHCRPEFELLRAVATGARGAEPPALATPLTRRAPRPGARLALAATIFIAVALGGEAYRRTSREAVVRGGGAADRDASVSIVSPTTNFTVQGDRRLTWHGVRGALAYEVELLDSTGTMFFTRAVQDTTLQLPDAAVAIVQRLGTFDWMVTARRSDENVRRSPVTRVRVTP